MYERKLSVYEGVLLFSSPIPCHTSPIPQMLSLPDLNALDPNLVRSRRDAGTRAACFKVIRHVQVPAPSRPIDRGLAGPGLLTHELVSKYADHLPLYRQMEIYAREGVDLDRSTLAGWARQATC